MTRSITVRVIPLLLVAACGLLFPVDICRGDKIPYVPYDKDPFRLDYEATNDVDELYLAESAMEARFRRDWPRAYFLYGVLVDMDGSNPEYQFERARVAYYQYKCDEAMKGLEQLPAEYRNPDLNLIKAGVYLCARRYEDALSLFSSALEERPDSIPVMRGKVEALLALKRYEEAADLVRRMLELNDGAIDDHPELKAALKNDGARGPERWSFILKVYAESKRLGSLFSPVDAATITFAQVDRDKGIELLVKAIEQDPDSADLHSRLGMLYSMAGRRELAKQHYDRAVELSPDNPFLANNRGVMALRLGQNEEAIRSFRRAVEIRPGYPEAFRNLARAHYRRKEWQDAAYAAQQSLIIDSGSVNASLLAGFSAYKLGYFGEALRYLDPVLEQGSDRSEVWFLAGICAHRLGRWDEAASFYRKGLALKPDAVLGLNNLADLLLSQPDAGEQEIHEALTLAEQASELTNHGYDSVEATLKQAREKRGALDQGSVKSAVDASVTP